VRLGADRLTWQGKDSCALRHSQRHQPTAEDGVESKRDPSLNRMAGEEEAYGGRSEGDVRRGSCSAELTWRSR
jgi:hypothetical protein